MIFQDGASASMSRFTALAILLVAALLEAAGDAVLRFALKQSAAGPRAGLFLLGAGILFSYGWVVNAPPWDFGKLLGLYVVFFFLMAQSIAWLAFGQPPTRPILLGGALIVCGGLVIAISNA